ncbi:MAG: hypothetical protein Q9178_002174 [Gyalolechia marmorata]
MAFSTNNLNTLNKTVAATLVLLSLLGFWGTWGIGGRSGFLKLIKDTLDAPTQLLPVVKQPVKHTYTGIPPIDALIRRLNVFLWPAIDGTWPGLCLVAWEFSGMFSATWMVAGLEGLRAPAFTLSYLIPTVLAALPSPQYTSWSLHQNIMAFWELYPVPFKILQIVFARYIFDSLASTPTTTSKASSLSEQKSMNLRYLRRTYIFAFAVSAFTHLTTLTLALSPVLFPSLFLSTSRTSLSPSNIFIPTSPFYNTPVKNLGEGLWYFLVWNMTISNIAPLVWGMLMARNAEGRVKGKDSGEGWGSMMGKVVGITLLAGPGAGTVWCASHRDELILGDAGGDGQRKLK